MPAHDPHPTTHDLPDDTAPTRRRFLAAAAAGAAASAGCLDVLGDDARFQAGDPPDVPQVEDPPHAVYVPTHSEGMAMYDPVEAGPYRVRPMLSYAHPFWSVTGDSVDPVEVEDEDVHVMATVWDPETGRVIPSDEGVAIRVYRGGDLVDEAFEWTMLSQTMGLHYGDNVELDGDGTYEVEIEVPPLSVRRTGAYEGRFEEYGTGRFEFEYDQRLRDDLVDRIAYANESVWGEPGALDPTHGMGGDESEGEGSDDVAGHGAGFAQVPPAESLPGAHQGTEVTGDADLALAVADGFLGDAPYLLASLRTPYNRVPLPGSALTARIRRDGETVAERDLVPTFDDAAGFHYGAEAPALRSGDVVEVVIDRPPQIARHAGYETAFLDTSPVEFSVGGE